MSAHPSFQITFICQHVSARVGTSKCRHRCRHLSTCQHVPTHRCRHPDCDIHSTHGQLEGWLALALGQLEGWPVLALGHLEAWLPSSRHGLPLGSWRASWPLSAWRVGLEWSLQLCIKHSIIKWANFSNAKSLGCGIHSSCQRDAVSFVTLSIHKSNVEHL